MLAFLVGYMVVLALITFGLVLALAPHWLLEEVR